MKDYKINEEEAIALTIVLKREWVPLELQTIIYNLVMRLEKELKS